MSTRRLDEGWIQAASTMPLAAMDRRTSMLREELHIGNLMDAPLTILFLAGL